jgi:phosphoribosylglycinamide formyltransferase-1
MNRLAIFASGSGSNAENIIHYFSNSETIQIAVIVINNPNAGVIERANRLQVPYIYFSNEAFKNGHEVASYLQAQGITHIILAGFLRLISLPLLQAFPHRIVNIHPALLPQFGGKGMHGMHVHEAVIASGSLESGITIHEVNERYDEGKSLFQAKIALAKNETPESLAAKIHELEQQYFPKTIESWLTR